MNGQAWTNAEQFDAMDATTEQTFGDLINFDHLTHVREKPWLFCGSRRAQYERPGKNKTMDECKIICERILEMLEAKETAQVPAIEFLPILGGIRSSPKKKASKTLSKKDPRLTLWTRRRSRCLATWSTSTTSTLTSTSNLSYDSHSTLQLRGRLCRRILL
jgi:hypothetical protein